MRSDVVIMEQLLHVVTARGRIDWAEWKHACTSVAAGGNLGMSPSDFLRAHEMLGHIELGFLGDSVLVCAAPAVLARLPSAGRPAAVLCGGRSPRTEEKVRAAAVAGGVTMTIEPPAAGRLPSARILRFSADEPAALSAAAVGAGITYAAIPPAWLLASAAGSVQGYLDRLDWRHGAEPEITALEIQPRTGRFTQPAPAPGRMRLLKYKPRVFRAYHELRCDDRFAKAERDWAAWACAREAGCRHVVHDSSARALAIPAFLGLPRPLARCLALCSGQTPVELAHAEEGWKVASPVGGYLVFTNIPGNIADLVLAKLGQDVLNSTIGTASTHE
jgi:hypothetical protein